VKLKSIFQIIQGHQITDEDIYKSIGSIPILTANNDIKGHWDKAIVTQQDLPCITYPTKCFSGQMFIQCELFDANNTAILIPFPEWRSKIILQWACFKLANMFLKVTTSKGGVSYLNKEIVEECDLIIPLKDTQEKELEYYGKIESVKSLIANIQAQLGKLMVLNLLIEKQPEEQVKLSEVLEYTSRNDCLSEEGIYQRSQELPKAKEVIKVISGSMDGFYGEIPLDNELHVVKSKPCLQVITRGRAGQIRFITAGKISENIPATNISGVLFQCRFIRFPTNRSNR